MASLWNDELIAELKRLHPTHSAADIAAQLGQGFTRCAILGKCHRLGLVSPQRSSKPKVPRIRVERKPILKIIRKNGNSDGMRVLQTTQATAPFVPRCVEIVPRHLTLMDLETGDCRYPYGDDTLTFCGHPVQGESSWCPSHHALCLLPPSPRRDQAMKRHGTDFGRRVFA